MLAEKRHCDICQKEIADCELRGEVSVNMVGNPVCAMLILTGPIKMDICKNCLDKFVELKNSISGGNTQIEFPNDADCNMGD